MNFNDDLMFELMPHNATYYNYDTDENCQLDYSELCKLLQTQTEDMKPLRPFDIAGHTFGMATVAHWWTRGYVQHVEVAAYAGVTGFKEYGDKKLAVIGAMITMPWVRRNGHGLATVSALLENASTNWAKEQFGHLGFVATWNAQSQGLLTKLGFSEAGLHGDKTLMTKMF